MPLIRVVYCSRNLITGDPASIDRTVADILVRSRRNNTASGITGGLLFSAGSFAQILEGPIDEVDETFERIQCDNRHAEVTVLRSEPIDGREFNGWSMAFVGTAAAPTVAGLASRTELRTAGACADALGRLLADVVARESDWLARAGAGRASALA